MGTTPLKVQNGQRRGVVKGGYLMTGRKCGTCKHFEPAPLWRKGWCRNPLLFSPQQSHLVNDEDLDCERGMGNYWEVADSSRAVESVTFTEGFREPVATVFAQHDNRSPILVSDIGQPVYPVAGGAGQGGDRPPYDDPPPGGGWSGGDPPPPSGDYNYYPEERYWTDYLRIAAPILGVILMVFLFWWWISNFIGDDEDENGEIANQDNTPVIIPTVGETPEPEQEATPADGTPGIVFPGDATPGAGDGTPGTTPGDTPGEPTTDTGTGEEEPPAQSGIYNGATVEVFNTGGTGVNVRSQPSTESDIISVFLDGTVLTVIGVSVEAEGFVWWPVSGDGVEGYVVQEYLSLIE